jgi:chaperonin GroES
MVNFKPTYNKVVVKLDPEKEKTIGGIIIPPTSIERKTNKATVVATGPGRIIESSGVISPCCVKPGDKVLITAFSGAPISINEEMYTILPDQDVICVFEE